MAAAVLDTSTLQALHRAGVLGLLPKLYADGLFLPASVDRQTRAALPGFGPAKVPDLAALDWIAVREVGDAELDPFRLPQPGQKGPKGPAAKGQLTCCGYKIDREEFEVVVLARRLGATAILDDHRGMDCADLLGVTVQTTRDILAALAKHGLVADVGELIGRIEATSYFPTRRFSRTARLELGLPVPKR